MRTIHHRPLGHRQQAVLEVLRRRNTYHPGCGWVYGTHRETVEILDSLAKRGVVECRPVGYFDHTLGQPAYEYRLKEDQ